MTIGTTQSTLQAQPIPQFQTIQIPLDGLTITLVGVFTSSLLTAGITWFFTNKAHKLTIDREYVKKVVDTKEQKDKIEMENAILLAVKNISLEIQGVEKRLGGEITGVRNELKVEIQGVEKRLGGEITGVRNELKVEIQGVEKRLGGEITGVRNELKVEIQGIRDQIYSTEKNLTHEISKTNSAVAVLTNMIDERVPKVPYNNR
jgi:hypothetical protein